ncbi:hypothetical protein [Sphingomonas sp.]|uniref:hypothetical protein n=1 Tax=Sphingomonas sp. TaxID=28214 RepID=UPI002DD662A3|nr:hypothetical protein [Sphingomonas sp.]
MIVYALLLAQAAAAQPACPATPAPLPADLAGWRESGADLSSGKAVTLATVDPKVALLKDVPPPARPGNMVVASFRVTAAGSYGVALDQRGWIDLYAAGGSTPLKSAKHGHGPVCSGIRKIVRFDLVPGEYRVVIGELEGASAKLMLVRG